MEIDVTKVLGVQNNEFEIAEALVNANQTIIDALHIMQSTIENFEDAESLKLNKSRMIKFFNRYAKD